MEKTRAYSFWYHVVVPGLIAAAAVLILFLAILGAFSALVLLMA